MTKTRTKPAGAQTAPAKVKAKTENVKLSDIQLDKLKAIQQKELAFQNELVAVRTQKNDLFELLLDAKGYDKDKMSAVTNIVLDEDDTLVVTLGR